MYEFFDHTADLGLRVRSTDLDALFREAAEGLFAIIVEDVPVVPGAERMDFRLQGERNDYLLFDWLNELLYVFDTRRLLFRDSNRQMRRTMQDTKGTTHWGGPYSLE